MLAGVSLIYFQLHTSAEQSAYRAATVCASPSTTVMSESCTYTGPATVTGSSRQTALSVSMTFTDLPGRSFTAKFSTRREPSPDYASIGASATAQLWGGRVTKFAGVDTADDPDYLPTNSLGPGVVFFIVGLGVTIWAIGLVRNAWRT